MVCEGEKDAKIIKELKMGVIFGEKLV